MVKYNYFATTSIEHFILHALAEEGVRADVANLTAKGLIEASLRGVDSHGVRLFPHYLAALKAGRINPDPCYGFVRASASTGKLDADHTFGHAAGIEAIRRAVELAQEAGSGHVSVKNSSHCGALAYFALEACKSDMIGMAYTHASTKLRTANSTRPFFGINPMCFAAPMLGEEPFCYDAAFSPISFNKVRQYRELGEILPPSAAADAEGEETRDADAAEQLIPIGDYKGYGMAMFVDILCGLLSGMPAGKDVSDMYGSSMGEKRQLGHFFSAFKISAFCDPMEFKQRLKRMVDDVRGLPKRSWDRAVMVAGDPEKLSYSSRIIQGVPLTPMVAAKFEEIALSYGVRAPARI